MEKASGNNLKFAVLICVSRNLDLETLKWLLGPWIKMSPATQPLPVQPLKGRGIPIKCLDQGHNKQTCRPILTPFTQCWTSSREAV